MSALNGQLSIVDGAIQKTLDLDAKELQTGSIVYAPLTDNVVLRLEITAPDASAPISESVRLVACESPLLSSHLRNREPSPAPRTSTTRVARSNADWARRLEDSKETAAPETPIVRSLLRTPRSEPTSSPSRIAPAGHEDGRLEPATLISRINPVYPAIARQSLISGPVEVQFHISTQGNVYDVKRVKGWPILAQAAKEAVMEWRYEPARLNGTPIDSLASTNFDFKLN